MNKYTLTPKMIAEVTGGRYIGSENEQYIPVTGAVRDNRDVLPGNLFVCIRGERTDGHLYANGAFDAGALCCLAEKKIPDAKGACILVSSTQESIKKLAAYHRKQFNIPVIGITGSVGKTTLKEMIAVTLGIKLNILKTDMNMNNELGVPLTLLSMNSEHDAAVVEMGISDFGEMRRLAAIVRPDIFIITSIGYSHTKELGDLNGVLRAKTEAFEYIDNTGIALLNGDDELLKHFDPGIKKITFGLDRHNDYLAENISIHGTEYVSADISYAAGRFSIRIPAYGSHLAALAPAVAAAAHILGLKDKEIKSGLSAYIPMEGRSDVSNVNAITLINDCYNANPSSVKAALLSLSEFTTRRVAILGDMLNLGDLSSRLHYDIGFYAAQCGINVLLCHGNESTHIVEGYMSAGCSEAEHYPDFDMLTAALTGKIKKGDAVLIKASRGMHFERLLPAISDLKLQ